MTIVDKQKLRVSESVVSAELEGEAVLLNVETGVYFGLDALGSEIWKHLEQGATEDAIFTQLLQEYEVEASQLADDLSTFLGLLQEKGLAKRED